MNGRWKADWTLEMSDFGILRHGTGVGIGDRTHASFASIAVEREMEVPSPSLD